MANISEILARAAALRDETALNSIDPERCGGIMYDTLIALNELWLQQGSALVISKIYASVAAMQADTAPVSDLTGRALRPGQIVVIASSDSDNGSVYRYNGTSSPSWSEVGVIGSVVPIDSLDSDSTALPLAAHQGKVLDGKINQLGQELHDINMGDITTGEFIVTQTGAFAAYSSYQRTGFIPIFGLKKLLIGTGVKVNNVAAIAFYSSNSTTAFISAVNSYDYTVGSSVPVDVPNGAKYCALCWLTTNQNKVFLKDNNNVPSDVVNLGRKIDELAAQTTKKYLYYAPIFTTGGYVNVETGGISSISSYSYSDYIAIIGGNFKLTQCFKDAAGLAFYDKYKNYISGYAKPSDVTIGTIAEITVPNDAVFVRVSCRNSDVSLFGMYSVSEYIIGGVSNKLSTVERYILDLLTINLGTLVNGFYDFNYQAFSENSDFKRTDYIKIVAKQIAVCNTLPVSNRGLAFFDKNKSFISDGSVDFGNYPANSMILVSVPENAYYFIYSSYNSRVNKMQVILQDIANSLNKAELHEDIVVNPCFYIESQGARTFKKVLCIGDSLTEGAFEYKVDGVLQAFIDRDLAWPKFFANMSGRQTTNAGDSGESIKSWWEIHQNDDLSGHDCCIIALGRNDYSSSPTTSAERIQCLTNIINKVKTENPQIKVFVSTLINYYVGADPDAVDADIITVVNSLADCYLLDIHTYGKMTLANDAYQHCTALGYEKLASYYFNYISYIMAQNPAEFKNIQFAGTNRYYN